MNKLMVAPLVLLLVMTLFTAINTGTHYTGFTPNYSSWGEGTVYINDTPSGTIQLSDAAPIEVNIWGLAGAVLVLAAALIIGIVSGLNIFGSGLSVESQKLLFQGTLFLGLWGTLSVAIVQLISASVWVSLFWIGLTIFFTIGFAMDMNGE